jgi:benzoyl-CoA-dihydrodiol lyase
VKTRALALADQSDRPADGTGVALTPLDRTRDADGLHYSFVDVQCDRQQRTATITVRSPETAVDQTVDGALRAGAQWWPLRMARELDDAILSLRTNELELGLWMFKTAGNPDAVLAMDDFMLAHQDHWFVREVLGMVRRTFARIDVSARSIFTMIEPGSCFAGTLFELALAADRVYMLEADEEPGAAVVLSAMNFGPLPAVHQQSRLDARFYGDPATLAGLRRRIGQRLSAREALDAGLVTAAPDTLDWDDELRQAIETRTALSPDALSGMEASLRFGLNETLETQIFGRLSAWQNWIFIRPNAVGTNGALKVYGTGAPSKFDWQRV